MLVMESLEAGDGWHMLHEVPEDELQNALAAVLAALEAVHQKLIDGTGKGVHGDLRADANVMFRQAAGTAYGWEVRFIDFEVSDDGANGRGALPLSLHAFGVCVSIPSFHPTCLVHMMLAPLHNFLQFLCCVVDAAPISLLLTPQNAGLENEAVYPPFMNHGIKWPAGVEHGAKLQQEHDGELLRSTFIRGTRVPAQDRLSGGPAGPSPPSTPPSRSSKKLGSGTRRSGGRPRSQAPKALPSLPARPLGVRLLVASPRPCHLGGRRLA
jgi:hypothetical protein